MHNLRCRQLEKRRGVTSARKDVTRVTVRTEINNNRDRFARYFNEIKVSRFCNSIGGALVIL